MGIDVARTLRTAIKTGKVSIGAKETMKALNQGNAKLVVIASNCPNEVRAEILLKAPLLYAYKGNSLELGSICGKPYTISALSVIDPGSSDIIALAPKGDEQ